MKAPEPVKAAPKPPAAKPKPKRKVVAPPPPPPETSLLDEILGNELALYGGGGFLLLLFIGYGYYAWRRKKSLQMESSVMATSELAVDSVFGGAGGVKVDTDSGESQEEGFSPSATTPAVETEEVDPIAEADVYMAYGRDTQAEEILKDALVKDPARQPIRAKLLEIYANRKDVAAFGATAAELHGATNGEGPEWAKAVALGLQLDPGNPLYAGAEGGGADAHATSDTQVVPEAAPDIVLDAGGEAEPSPGLDFDLGAGEQAPAGQPEAAPATDSTADLGFDLDLGKEEAAPAAVAEGEAPAAAPADAGASIDFDFELPGAGAAEKQPEAEAESASPAALELPQVEAAPGAAEAPAAAADGGGIDFDFNLDLPAEKEEAPAAAPSEAASAPMDLSSISLELGAPGEAAAPPDAHWQEVATKLDLAKAYQEMGDKDGARELLNEVLKEGDEAQQQQAQTILAALG